MAWVCLKTQSSTLLLCANISPLNWIIKTQTVICIILLKILRILRPKPKSQLAPKDARESSDDEGGRGTRFRSLGTPAPPRQKPIPEHALIDQSASQMFAQANLIGLRDERTQRCIYIFRTIEPELMPIGVWPEGIRPAEEWMHDDSG